MSVVVFTQNLNFLLWSQLPTGTSLVSCDRSQAIPLWLLGPAQVSEHSCLGRAGFFLIGHPPESTAQIPAQPSSESSGVNCSLSAPLEGDWARDVCGFFPLSELSQGRKDREVLKVFKMRLENPKANSGLNLKMTALLCYVTSIEETSPV